MRRRNFLQTGLIGLLGFFNFPGLRASLKDYPADIQRKPLPKRLLGRTGERLSIVGLGGVVYMNKEQKEVNQIIGESLDHGVNYFDVAPTYGNAEELLGPALKAHRDRTFLACKTQKRDQKGAEEELHQSLNRLQTDWIDLYQLHALTTLDEVYQALGKGGAVEAFLKAKKEGKIRYLGFSAHSSEAALKAMELFDFDTILLPINYVCFFQARFGPSVVEKAKEKDMGILAIKSLARQPWPSKEMRKHWPRSWYQPILDPYESYLALRFTLDQPVTSAIPPGDIRLYRRALEMAHSYTPLNNREQRELKHLSQSLTPLFQLQSES
ncbi:aldo/keto reductase [bacterium]|nr:aldo/keto reductase [bacterium]